MIVEVLSRELLRSNFEVSCFAILDGKGAKTRSGFRKVKLKGSAQQTFSGFSSVPIPEDLYVGDVILISAVRHVQGTHFTLAVASIVKVTNEVDIDLVRAFIQPDYYLDKLNYKAQVSRIHTAYPRITDKQAESIGYNSPYYFYKACYQGCQFDFANAMYSKIKRFDV